MNHHKKSDKARPVTFLIALSTALLLLVPAANADPVGETVERVDAIVDDLPPDVAPIFEYEERSPCQDERQDGENGSDDPLCPEPNPGVSCASAALAVRAHTLGVPHTIAEGTSRASADAFSSGNGYGYSQSDSSGALHQTQLLAGNVKAGTLESTCDAWAQSYGGWFDGCAKGTADAQRVEILGTEFLVLDSTTEACTWMFGAQHDSNVVCVSGGCLDAAPNTAFTLAPGVTVILNEQGSDPTYAFGMKTLHWTAAVHVIVDDNVACSLFGSCTGTGLDIYVSYTSVAMPNEH